MNCSKKSFEDIDKARIRLTKIVLSSEEQVKPIRVYLCEYCGKYHLTSKTKEQYKKNLHEKSVETKRRNRKREQSFIRRESVYWERHFDNLIK